MVGEFDNDSERYYHQHLNFIDFKFEEIREYHRGYGDAPEINIDPWLVDMKNDLFKYKNNVFIPEKFKNVILKFYDRRIRCMVEISDEALNKYINLFKEKKIDCEDDGIGSECWGEINNAYYDNKIGWSDVELKVQDFNALIQDYLFKLE